MLTLPQNGRNLVSEDSKFKNFPGKPAPRPPYWGTTLGSPPSPKILDPRQNMV